MLDIRKLSREKQEEIKSLTPIKRNVLEQLQYENNFGDFCRSCLGFKDMLYLHYDLCEFLQYNPMKFKLILMPRYSFKSTICTVGISLWELIKNPNARILIYSDATPKAEGFLDSIKAHIEDKAERSIFRQVFGAWEGDVKTGRWNRDQIIISVRTNSLPEPSVDTGGIETSKVGFHYDCLLPDTQIYTSNGYKKVKDVYRGCRVLSSDGKFHRVLNIIKKKSDKPIISIRAKYQSDVNRFTEDHKIYAFHNNNFQWVEAKNLSLSDYLVVPRLNGRNHNLSRVNKRLNKLLSHKDIWRLIGYWLAEGCATYGNSIRFSFGSHEDKYIKDVVGIIERLLGKTPSVTETKSSTKVIFFTDKDFKTILNTLGRNAKDKNISPFFLNHSFDLQRELLLGYWRGDGCINENSICFTSISKDLLTGIQLLLAKVGIQSSLRKSKISGKNLVVGNICNTNDSYSLTTTNPLAHILFGSQPEFPTRPFRSFFVDKFWCIPIEEIHYGQGMENNDVFDIEVEETHDFYCPGMIVHNCIIFDDIVSDKNITTKDQMDKVVECYKKALSMLKPGGNVLICGTRWHFGDLYGRIIAENDLKKNFAIFKKEAEFDEKFGAYPFAKIGLTQEFLASQKLEQGSSLYSSLYLNNPCSDETAVFKMSNFAFYGDVLKDDLYITATCDPAGEGEDFTAITVVGTDNNMDMYILDVVNKHLQPSEIVEELVLLQYKWGYKILGIETNFFRGMLEPEIKRRRDEEHRENPEDFNMFGVEEFEASSKKGAGKHNRIMSLQPFHERRSIKFPGEKFELLEKSFAELAWQMVQYTHDGAKSPHEDCIDALAYQVKLIRKGGIAKKADPPYHSPAWLELQSYNKEIKYNMSLPRRLRREPADLAFN